MEDQKTEEVSSEVTVELLENESEHEKEEATQKEEQTWSVGLRPLGFVCEFILDSTEHTEPDFVWKKPIIPWKVYFSNFGSIPTDAQSLFKRMKKNGNSFLGNYYFNLIESVLFSALLTPSIFLITVVASSIFAYKSRRRHGEKKPKTFYLGGKQWTLGEREENALIFLGWIFACLIFGSFSFLIVATTFWFTSSIVHMIARKPLEETETKELSVSEEVVGTTAEQINTE